VTLTGADPPSQGRFLVANLRSIVGNAPIHAIHAGRYVSEYFCLIEERPW
jgi:hypothetical protein